MRTTTTTICLVVLLAVFGTCSAGAVADYPVPGAIPFIDCTDTDPGTGLKFSDVLNVSILPFPQELGKPWTIRFWWLSTINITADLEPRAIIQVKLDGWLPVHTENIWLCNSSNPIAKKDGFDRCPYNAGQIQSIHDTNTIPNIPFIPLKTYTNKIFILSKSGNALLCFTFNQTYTR